MKIFDCHFHIIDDRFPLVPNQGYLPDAFTCSDYYKQAKQLGVVGGAIVSGSFQAFDQTYLTDALARLGPTFVGVTQLPMATPDEEIISLNKTGIRAVRFNLYRGGWIRINDLEFFAKRVYELVGWHVEIYVDMGELGYLYSKLLRLPVFVIDHLGLSRSGLPILRKLVEQGGYAKASGFGRIDFDPGPAIRDLVRVNPDAVMFGTDLPSTRAPRAFREQDILLMKRIIEPDKVDKVLYRNAVELYKPKINNFL